MTDISKIAVRASTQDHLEIEDIQDGIVILKNGNACLVLAVSSINFDLLSEKEQEATIYAYASLLNSLTFPIQIVIRSQQKDISAYLKLLDETAEKTKRQIIKKQILQYRHFIQETVQKNNVLDKKFYLTIPMSALETNPGKVLAATLNPKKSRLPFSKEYILQKAKINLYPKRDYLLSQLTRLGIRGHQLETKDLIKLFFDIYNSASHGQQIIEAKEYQAPMMQSTLIPSPPTAGNSSIGQTMHEKINHLVKESVK